MNCDKNSEEWEKAKQMYPPAFLEGSKTDLNEKARVNYINTIAGRCQERVMA
jgi:hypothetical protein